VLIFSYFFEKKKETAIKTARDFPEQHVLVFPKYRVFNNLFFQNTLKTTEFA